MDKAIAELEAVWKTIEEKWQECRGSSYDHYNSGYLWGLEHSQMFIEERLEALRGNNENHSS